MGGLSKRGFYLATLSTTTLPIPLCLETEAHLTFGQFSLFKTEEHPVWRISVTLSYRLGYCTALAATSSRLRPGEDPVLDDEGHSIPPLF